MSTIKNYIWVVLVLGLAGIPLMAQKAPSKSAKLAAVNRTAVETSAKAKKVSPRAQVLSAEERETAIDTSISTTCGEEAPKTPRYLGHDAQVFSTERVASTLHGVWLGRVSGEYDKQLFAKDGFLNVDYYMVVDVTRGEAFVLQEFGPNRPGAALRAKPGAPTWSYVWCAKENYKSPSPRQIHEFVKVSDNVEDARELLSGSTGLKMGDGQVVLSNVWRTLVDMKFFDDPKRSLAYAGAMFKPITMGNRPDSLGGSLFELRMVGEYRGIGQTAAKFQAGEPIHNVEMGKFLGVSMDSGDFLVASIGLGNEEIGPKQDDVMNTFSTQMAFDKVVIGPLGSEKSLTRKTAKK